MIHTYGRYIFHEHHVAFHVDRENSFSPWRVIGVYVSYNGWADCMYLEEFSYIRENFKNEVKKAGNLCSTTEFLENWRKYHCETNSVISKVINYCSESNNSGLILQKLASQYNGVSYPDQLAKIAIMLKNRERYFPVVFHYNDHREEVLDVLKKAGAI